MGVRMHAKRPALPMVAVVVKGRLGCLPVYVCVYGWGVLRVVEVRDAGGQGRARLVG